MTDRTELVADQARNAANGEWERGIQQAEEDAHAAYLKASGMTYRQIAKQVGVSVSAAYDRVQRALAAVPVESVQQLRRVEAERLDLYTQRLMTIALGDHYKRAAGGSQYLDRGVNIAALRELRLMSESRRKLFGVDAPEEIRVTVKDQLVSEIERLAAELNLSDAEVAEVMQS